MYGWYGVQDYRRRSRGAPAPEEGLRGSEGEGLAGVSGEALGSEGAFGSGPDSGAPGADFSSRGYRTPPPLCFLAAVASACISLIFLAASLPSYAGSIPG